MCREYFPLLLGLAARLHLVGVGHLRRDDPSPLRGRIKLDLKKLFAPQIWTPLAIFILLWMFQVAHAEFSLLFSAFFCHDNPMYQQTLHIWNRIKWIWMQFLAILFMNLKSMSFLHESLLTKLMRIFFCQKKVFIGFPTVIFKLLSISLLSLTLPAHFTAL